MAGDMAENTAASSGRPLIGILLVALATLSFASADTLTKHLALLYPVPVVVAVRYVVNVALLAAFLGPRLGPRLWQTRRIGLHLLRGLSLAAGSLTMAWALQLMPVGETVAIVYLAPLAVMLLAGPLLGERVAAAGWAGAAVGFLGVVLIARPGGGLDPLGVFYAATNAGFATVYHLLTRLLSRTESTPTMLFHTACVGAFAFCLLAIPHLPAGLPAAPDLGLMALLGVLMTIGHFLFTAAYREAPASQLAPVNYLHLVWAGGLGWLVFGHLPDTLGAIGIALVAFAGALVALLARGPRGKAPTVLPAIE